MIGETIVNLIAAFLTMILTAALMALPVMWLWNWLMPTLFGLIEITYFPAMGIVLLSDILFKGGFGSTITVNGKD